MVERGGGAGPTRRGRPPWGFLGMIGLVAALEWTLAGHDLDFTTPMQWDWRVIGKAATRPDRVAGKDVLIFGDSLLKFGVMPHVIKKRSGLESYNFALHTGQTSTSYFMFRRALRAGARPSAVVLDLTPHMLAFAPEINNALWPELLTPAECVDLSWSMGAPDFLTSKLLAEVLTSYKERHDLRAAIVACLAGKSSSRRDQVSGFHRNWKLNQGAQLFCEAPPPSLDVWKWNADLYARWWPHPVNLAYLDRFLALARSREIPVYWLLPPIHPGVQEVTEKTGFDAHYTEFVRQTQARFPGTVVVDARHSGFTDDHFFDVAHVDRKGAMRMSTALADLLAGRPDRSPDRRWLTLEVGPAGVLELPLEDVFQSTAALHDQGKRRRR